MRHVLSLDDLTSKEVQRVIEVAQHLKRDLMEGQRPLKLHLGRLYRFAHGFNHTFGLSEQVLLKTVVLGLFDLRLQDGNRGRHATPP